MIIIQLSIMLQGAPFTLNGPSQRSLVSYFCIMTAVNSNVFFASDSHLPMLHVLVLVRMTLVIFPLLFA